jgi:hypothetical protein
VLVGAAERLSSSGATIAAGRCLRAAPSTKNVTPAATMSTTTLDARARSRARGPTSADVEKTKPEPDLVAAAIEKPGGGPAVMVGDSTWDCEAAKRAGVPTVAVLTGGFSAAELREAERPVCSSRWGSSEPGSTARRWPDFARKGLLSVALCNARPGCTARMIIYL